MSARNPGQAATGRRDSRAPGMRRGHTQTVDSKAVRRVHDIIEDDLKWHFGRASLPDYGADALAEIVTDDDRVTGGLIGFQIKGGGSWFERPKGDKGWVFRERNDHLAYWLGYSVPVVVVLVNDNNEAFWQVVSTKTITEHKKTFTMVIPRSQPFDGTARDGLTALVRRGGLLQELPLHRSLLPAAAVKPLRRAEETDQLGAARLADQLANGRTQPGRTVSYLLDMQPSWLSRSAAAQDLWLAVGAYAQQHGFPAEAGKAFAKAADNEGTRSPLASAAAALALLFHDRAAARTHALRARDGGLILLADMCLSLLEVPEGDGKPAEIPPSIAAASAEELDASPNVLSFLAEVHSRRGDLTQAVGFAERALRNAGDQDSAVRLQLASLLNRRSAASDMSVRDYRRALSLAGEVVEERRRWDGPSAEALALLLDLHIRGDDAKAALRAALPAGEGGTARDAELDWPVIAFSGGLAALGTRNDPAYRFFISKLPDGPHRRELLAVECELAGQPADRQIQARLDVLHDPADEAMAGRCIAALAKLGHWPPEADQLRDRHVLPGDTYEILRAICRFRTGERDTGLARLRELSDASALAAIELVRLIEEHHGAAQAIEECERQITRWQAPDLALKLIDLHGRTENFARAEELVRSVVSDASFTDDIRVGLCNWYAARKGGQGDFSEAAAYATRGLEIRDDITLAWSLVRALFNDGKIIKARQALTRYQPDPVTHDETGLWLQLHLSVPLTPGDARTMTGIAQRLPDGELRDFTIGLLIREVLLTPPGSAGPFPGDITHAVAELRNQAPGRPGGGLELDNDDDETLRAALRDSHPDPAAFHALIRDVQGGRKSHAEVARFVGRPYAAVLLQRPAGVLPAIDLRPGLRSAGETAAEQAATSRSCVADLSSLHLLCLIADDDRLHIRAKMPDLIVARSAVTDAVLTRDQMRGLGISTYTAALRPDGSIERTTLTATQQAALRDQAEALEAVTSSLQTRTPAARKDAATDTIAIALESGLPLWCDDSALRQRARACGLPAFSLLDLVTVLARRGAPAGAPAMLRRLAAEYVADLPLDVADIIAVAASTSWDIGPAHTALARPAWWEYHAHDWADAWLQISAESRKHAAVALISITKAALAGAISSVTTSLRTKRYQELTVLALVGCYTAGQPAPLGLLDQLAAFIGAALVPRPEYILQALERELANRSVPDPYSSARTLLHRMDN